MFFNFVVEIVLCYYEKWDGIGYLRGLREEVIFESVCIVVIVDVFDVFIMKRFYKKVWVDDDVFDYFKWGLG